jgi:hypothetical protein
MKLRTLRIVVFLAIISSIGCTEKTTNPTQKQTNNQVASGSTSVASVTKKASTSKLLSGPTEEAHRDYIAAYNEYVRLLRESGPQTLETLQALQFYQQKYKIYQMLLKAENEGNSNQQK